MARDFGVAMTDGEEALAAATAETVLQVIAAANHRIAVLGWGVFFDAVSVTAEPVQVILMRQTDAGAGSDAALVSKVQTTADTIQTTALENFSGEPTPGDFLDVLEVHPQSGYEIKFPPGHEIWMDGGTRIGIQCTAPATVNVRAKVFFEE